MRGEEGTQEKSDADRENADSFRCLSCGNASRKGSGSCEACGMRYVLQDEDCDLDAIEESASDAKIDDLEPIVDQGEVDCGYFDVDSGTISFTGPKCGNKYELSECQNCATMLEVPLRSCPLCGGKTKKLDGGIGTVLSGAVSWGRLSRESRAEVFCQSCGEMVTARNGRCEVCGGDLVPQVESLSDPILRPKSAEPVVFVHMNFESGRMSYLTEGDRSAPSEAEAELSKEEIPALGMDIFGRIGMMFDEQTSVILDLTSNGAMTASEICRRLEIPRSVCYRKLKTLTDANILRLSRPGEEKEWHASRYCSNVEMAYVAFEHGEMRMMMRFKDSRETQTQKFSSDVI